MKNNSFRIASIILAVLLVASLIWGFMEKESKNLVRADLDKERLRNESLLSEKLSVEKERDKARQSVQENEQKVKDLSLEIESIRRKLQDNSTALRRALNENSSSKKKYADLLATRTQLENELASLTSERDNLKKQGQQSQEELAKLKGQNQKLEEDLRLARLTHYDKPRVEATRGTTDKLVVKARRVQKLKATLAVNAAAEDLKFTVIDPKGVTLTESDGSVASRVLGTSGETKQVEITFAPKKKLQAGMYQIEVVSGASHVASLQVSLR